MGAGNAKLVYAHWPELPHAAFRALVYMALVSLDKDDPPRLARRFYAGREALALALGVIVPAEVPGDKQVAQERRAGFARVDRAIGELLDVGAIEVKSPAYFRHNAEYALDLTGEKKPREKKRRGRSAPTESTTVSVTVGPR